MNTSLQGLKFIACREALVLKAYEDGKFTNGAPRYSIGFGSQTPLPQEGSRITVEEAFARLRIDIENRDKNLRVALATTEIKQAEWDALASLNYQRGSAALIDVAGYFRVGPAWVAIAAFLKWNSGQDGVPTPGHTKRRIQEMAMAFGTYGDLGTFKCFSVHPREGGVASTQEFPF